METLSGYLEQLRCSRGLRLSNIATYMHENYPRYAVTTIQTDYLHNFLRGLRRFNEAMDDIEPARTLFLLYINALNPNKRETREIIKLARKHHPNFRFEPLERLILGSKNQ